MNFCAFWEMGKRQMTPEEVFPILRSVNLIGVMTAVIQVEIQNKIVDIKFKNPNTSNQVSKIRSAADQIRKDLAYQFKVKDLDSLNNDHALAMWRIFDHFTELSTQQINDFMDGVDQFKKEGE